MNWYLEVLKKYAVFSGRARRKEFWMFTLFNLIVVAVLAGLAVGTKSGVFWALYGIYGLAVLLPGWGVTVRRLHDTSRSGWWILFYIVPIVGPITLLVFLASEGKAEPNQYGPNPKYVAAA